MKHRSIAVLAGLVLGLGMTVAGEADFHNCGICKPMMAEPSLMQNMKWDTQSIATGMISITTVSPSFEAAFEKAHAEMMAKIKQLEAGTEMELCPFCQGMTKLAASGAKIENLAGAGAHVTAVTSQDPAVIQQIHDHVKRVQQEFSKMKHPEHKG